MSNPENIRLEDHSINDLNFTFITDPDSRFIRANVLLPFDPSDIISGNTPYEAPHVLEHVICDGDGSIPADDYREKLKSHGGYTNAFTAMTINGKLGFETTQPENKTHLARYMVNSVFYPALNEADIEEEKQIVKNELRGYQQNPSIQRHRKKDYDLGITYKTDDLGLSNLDDIDSQILKGLHSNVLNKDNARLVLSGNPESVEKLAQQVAEDLVSVRSGGRNYSTSYDHKPLPDYHADVPELEERMTDYMNTAVSENSLELNLNLSELRIIVTALHEAIASGREGIHDLSRARGLSYGVQTAVRCNPRQLGVSISDTTQMNHVSPQIDLLDEVLKGVSSNYDIDRYVEFRNKQLGALKISPFNFKDFVGVVEAAIPTENSSEIVLPYSTEKSLAELSPNIAVEAIRSIAVKLREPDYINRYAFGANPF